MNKVSRSYFWKEIPVFLYITSRVIYKSLLVVKEITPFYGRNVVCYPPFYWCGCMVSRVLEFRSSVGGWVSSYHFEGVYVVWGSRIEECKTANNIMDSISLIKLESSASRKSTLSCDWKLKKSVEREMKMVVWMIIWKELLFVRID